VLNEFSSMSSDRQVVGTVAAADDVVIAVLYRQLEPFVPEAGLHVVVISVEGDVDCDSAAHLESALWQAIDAGAPVCCDLGAVGYFGAAGARVLLSAVRHASDRGALFLVRGVYGMARRVLDAVGFDQALIFG
jgi:anti-anti-sigma factor